MPEHPELGPYPVDYPSKPRGTGEGGCRSKIKKRSRAIDGELHCERCGLVVHDEQGATVVKSLHHRRKKSALHKSRFWEPSNCVVVCGDGTTGCHGWIEHNPDAARETGWHVRSFEEAYEVPIEMWHGWVMLDDEGGMQPWDGGSSEPTICESDPLF